MSVDIEENVNTNFALQIDESTDISELIKHTKGQDIFEIVNSYFKQSNISWKMCVGICTDGAPSMVGSIKGFITLAKQININIIHTHCFLHREALIAKTLPQELKAVLDQTITMVNYIKLRPLKSRLFKQLCNAMDAKHECLLLHTEVRWLSRGKVLMRVFELKEELLEFYSTEGNITLCELLKNEKWCAMLAYLADIFNYINGVNTNMQGREENILTSTDKLLAFQKKIVMWKRKVTENNFEIYNLTFQEEEELISISADHSPKIKFSEEPIEDFWISMKEQFSKISEKALIILLQFSTSYLCELGFSTLTNIKTKKREKLLGVEEEIRVALSSIRPRISLITKNKQSQVSH
ncbi:zinc finger BED domain-containing protein 5-like [Aphis gossypii]|uniref:zinc finger BED domain-containing protein 5-like n=1 Tax=Aphis gossypii TaxID=80765 RepID=UPI002158C226|nr:zinc finger BED domain-containing protein 5-like [Aphis gossypii]